MYITTGTNRRYAVTNAALGGEVRYELTEAPAALGATVKLFDDSGGALRQDAVADWLHPRLEGCAILLSNAPEPVEPLPVERTPAENREAAYDTDKCIPWQGAEITVTEAARLWTYYTSEGDAATATVLTEEIARAKGVIRGRFPDLDTGGDI